MRAKRSENSDLYSGDEFVDWYNSLKEFEANGASPKVDNPVRLLYEDIETLWKPIVQDNNWSEFIKKLRVFKGSLARFNKFRQKVLVQLTIYEFLKCQHLFP